MESNFPHQFREYSFTYVHNCTNWYNWAITVTEKTMGVAPTKKYHIPQLATGNQYHVRIASGNEFGFGLHTTTTIRNGGQNADGFLDFPVLLNRVL